MLLRSRDGKSVETKIVGYEYPDKAPDPDESGQWDANWLFIEAKSKGADSDWRFAAPCMLTMEAETLYQWLLAIERRSAEPELGFMEPELSFEILEYALSYAKLQVVHHVYDRFAKEYVHFPVILELTYDDLKQAAVDWYAEIQRFPVRYRKSTL